MDEFCGSLCVQKTLWKEQSDYAETYNMNDSPEMIIANFTDSACLSHNGKRCGNLLLKILNNDFGCSGLKYPRVFPFSGNYTLCTKEVEEIIKDYGPCVNSLFGNKSGDWLNLYKEIYRYAITRRLKNYKVFEQTVDTGTTFNRTYKIGNFDWTWYQSNDRTVSTYILDSIAFHLGITPSMISGQGFNDYSIMIKGLTDDQRRELDDEHTMTLTMFSGKISVDAVMDQTKGFTISAGINLFPNMFRLFIISAVFSLFLFF